jgi:hypothetical protein
MSPWLLLMLTLVCGWLTYDAFRWKASLKEAPFSVIRNLWKGGLAHPSVAEQNKLKERYA